MKTKQETVTATNTTTRTMYVCGQCDRSFGVSNDCARHEWSAHYQASSATHTEEYYDVDIEFRLFPSEAVYDCFCAVNCAVKPRWDGAGWYREFLYMDRCRGCDMGETTGLKKVCDVGEETWVTDEMRERANAIDDEVMFDPPTGSATFEFYGDRWRRRSTYLASESVDIVFASPDSECPARDDVVAAWRVWREDH